MRIRSSALAHIHMVLMVTKRNIIIRHPDKAWARVFPRCPPWHEHRERISNTSRNSVPLILPISSLSEHTPVALGSLLYPVEFRFVNTDLEGASVGWDVPTLVDEHYRKQVPKSGFLCRSDNSPNAVPWVVEFEGSALAGFQIVHKPPPASVRK